MRSVLGRGDDARLTDTRLQLHHAVQALTSFAQALIDPREGDAHRNFDWDIGVRGFRTREASNAPGVTAVFAVEEFEIRVEREDAILAEVPARGASTGGLRRALATAVRRSVPSARAAPEFVAPEFELPNHPVADTDADVALAPDMDALGELAAWFTHADLALLRLTERVDPPVDPARAWPHHFDLATLIRPSGGTVGVGLSPGDTSIPHPYWYVRGYPDEEVEADGGSGVLDHLELPEFDVGRWKFDGWTGAILEAPSLSRLGTPEEQDGAVDRFLDTAVSTFLRSVD